MAGTLAILYATRKRRILPEGHVWRHISCDYFKLSQAGVRDLPLRQLFVGHLQTRDFWS